MDIFHSRYYKTNYSFLRLLGLWPSDDFLKKRIKRIIVVSLIVSLIIPQIIRLVEEWNRDVDIMIEVIGSLIYFFGCQIKYLSFLKVESKMKFLYEEISKHWNMLTNKDEQKILQEYTEVGRIMALIYLIPINIILVVYITLPLAPVLLDMIDPLNETRPRAFPYFAEYFIDDQKYYFELTAHGWVVCILSVQIYGTFDTTYALCVQHSCALFVIVEYMFFVTLLALTTYSFIRIINFRDRMKKATGLATSNKFTNASEQEKELIIYNRMVDAILLHKQAIQFVNLIEECYTFVFFCVVTLNTAVVSLAAVDTMLNLENGNTKQMIRIGMLYIGFSLHLLFNMNPGQKVIDSSSHIREAAFHCDWFNVSQRTKRLLRIIMLRSMIPCTFTANKLVVLDLECFAFVFKKSISYVTMIGSMRS